MPTNALRRLALLPLISGILAIIVAGIALFWPQHTITFIVVLLGIYLLVSGLGTIGSGIALRGLAGSGLLIAGGITVTAAGILMIWHPVASMNLLTGLMGLGLILLGITALLVALQIRRAKGSWPWSAVAGIVSTVLGIIFMAHPGFAADTLGILLGVGILAFGIALTAAGSRLRRTSKLIDERLNDPAFHNPLAQQFRDDMTHQPHDDMTGQGEGEDVIIESDVVTDDETVEEPDHD